MHLSRSFTRLCLLTSVCLFAVLYFASAASAYEGARIVKPVAARALPNTGATIATLRPGTARCFTEYRIAGRIPDETGVMYLQLALPRQQLGWVAESDVRVMLRQTPRRCGVLAGDLALPRNNANAAANFTKVRARLELLSEKLGKPLYLNAGYRTYAEQAVLYQSFLNGNGAPANPPGQSEHQFGYAADVEIGTKAQAARANLSIGNNPRAKRIAKSLGFTFPHSDEPWHIEYR